MKYLPRLADDDLAFRLKAKGAVLFEGPKWCGKTTTARAAATSVLSMDQPEIAAQYRQMAETAPTLLLEGETPRLIDEWQVAPTLWNTVRYEVDRRGEPGQFILTGSAVPVELDSATHTGTGRITRMRMRPMSLFESGDSTGHVSLRKLFDGDSPAATAQADLEEIAYLLARGGWPQAVTTKDRKAALFMLGITWMLSSQTIFAGLIL